MCHLGDKDVRGLGNTTAGAVLLPGHHRVVSETIICFPCLEHKILFVSIQEQKKKTHTFDMVKYQMCTTVRIYLIYIYIFGMALRIVTTKIKNNIEKSHYA